VQALGWDDLYQKLIGERQLTQQQVRDVLRAVQRERQTKCC